ncbi:MAG: glycosyltransferase family 4 protein [Rhodothermaceae bacterium]|nr:glycosyltransferase family 4 protein [Rhodothermaceae bacterium]
MQRVCVQWPRFGPYHLARLRAAHRLFQKQGVEIVGLETAGDDSTYAWEIERASEPFLREQVFPNRVFETIPADEMEAGVTAALDRLDPDAVAIVSYSFPDARACLAWCRRHGRTAVLMASTREEDAVRVPWREWIKARIISQYDAALVAGTPQRRYLAKLGFPPGKIFQPCTVVDNAFFYDGAERARSDPSAHRHLPGLDDDTPFFLASNRLLPRKNIDRLLLAYEQYREQAARPWRLLLLGDGPERPRLEALIRDRRIEGVVWCGFRQIDELPVYYGLAGAFVHPCLMDQWGLVINEAMAAGLPVVVSRAAGCTSDLVQEGTNGYTFDPEDVDTLAQRLIDVASPHTDRETMGARSREIVAAWAPEHFSKGLWNAVQAGRGTAERGLSPVARSLLWALRRTAGTPEAFHSVDTAPA